MAAVLNIEVVYGGVGQMPVSLRLPLGATVGQAIEASGLAAQQALGDLQGRVGIFGRLCEVGQLLEDGDRVEIYRPLLADPKEARRQRVSTRRKAERSGF